MPYSDHLPLVLKLKGLNNMKSKDSKKFCPGTKYSWVSDKAISFKGNLRDLAILPLTGSTLNSQVERLTIEIQTAMSRAGMRRMPSHQRSNLSQRSNSSRVQHAYSLRETRAQNIRRLREQSARQATLRSLETPDPIHSRLQAHSERYSSTRRNTRTNIFFGSVWSSMENAGFNYSFAVEYFKHPLISLGMMDTTCRFCGALRWKDESSGMCCSNGKVRLPLIDLPPEPLRSLLSGENSDSVHFLRNIRKYNSCFQMTSFGAENQTHSVTFPTTFSIQGQVYHRIGSLMPSENQPSRFPQIYFMGNDDDDDIQTDRRCQQIQGVRRNIVQGLQRMLHQHNLLVLQFKTALENLPSDAYRVVVNADRTPGQHPRRYNAPTANEVAVVLAGNQFGSRDIVLRQRDNVLQHVSDTHRFYDALQYPLIFWKGQEGYYFHIPQIDPNTRQPLSSKVSSMDIYGYFIMVRRNSPNVIAQFGQLFHQFLVDMYTKVESERLRYITLHQRNLRAESYIHLRDALSTDANINPNSLGQRIILPSSFVNSPRYLAEYTQDAFCYVRKFGSPDLFITFTSNPSWEELSAALLPGQKQLDRHDITARVFRQKLVKFIGALTKGQLYGATVAWMYSVEWQKRGLPHAHILVWLANKLRPTQIDSVISAEFPDPIQDTLLRRAPEAGGFTAKVKIRGREEVTIDNRWVVPYSPLLSKVFCAHINVENCSSVKAIKYICKYINKGSDQAIINLRREGRGPDPQNEVRMYQCARYISSNEVVWRLLSFPLHQHHPAVIHLAVHLENGKRIYFNQNTLAHRMRNPPRTTLTAFFSLCQTDSFARTLLYPDVPQYYTWNSSAREWRRRVQGKLVEGWPGVKRSDTIGRVYSVHGPPSFAYLKIVNGSQYETFRETCAALGLLENDNHWVVTMDEAILCQAPTRVRQLFAILISTCTISNPQQLWITYRDEMASDILHRYQLLNSSIRYNDLIYNETLCNIEDRVVSICGKKLQELGLGAPRRNVVTNSDILRELAYDTAELEDNVASMMPKLLPEQRRVFDAVLEKNNLSQPIIIFLDAPGGTGKTFLLNLLLAMVRKEQNIAIAVASSGIAATLLVGGRTAHSVLKLPLTFAEGQTAVCNNEKIVIKLHSYVADIRDDTQPMGGLVVLLAGDFRQTLPVVTRGTPADELNACLKSSYLWSHIVKMYLTVNMRVQLHNDTTAAQFADELLKIGEGQLKTDSEGESTIYRSIDTMVDPDESVSYPPEFLNSLELSGTPSHKIVLKVGVPVILIRNLDPPRLCNGTRLCITQMGTNVLQARILTGSFRGEEVLIPRIPIIPNDLPFKFRRLQFPVMVAFAMTINKSQGQTLQDISRLDFYATTGGELDRYPLRNKRKIDSVEPEETSMNVKKEDTQVSNYVVQHLPRNPSIFSGEDGKDLQKWLKGYARVARYNHWDETLCLTKVYFYLSGTALKWFENNEESIQTWKEFTSQLENVFGKKENSKLQAEKKLKTRAQLKGESTECYIQDLLCLCKEADPQMSEEDKISHLMKGIALSSTPTEGCTEHRAIHYTMSPCRSAPLQIVREEVQRALGSPREEPKNATIEEIVKEEIGITLAPISKSRRSPPQKEKPRQFLNTRYEAVTIRPHPEPRYPKQGGRRDTNDWRTTEGRPICFYCGRPGHVVRYCRDRKRHNEERRNDYFQRKQDAMVSYNSRAESQDPNDESSRKTFTRYRSPTSYRGQNRQHFSPARRSSWTPRH
ncbi:hypothetical protein LAZ67_10002175 [Cordylochernes scorpioides]|uniref:ATP-dependent DNA helicase n=1 Tax=Cordylochernes scorpioides TaxID=51811 RepID=A0ABY6KWH8_9ARAC|nr:hypothetical protein LAZ67_10002175 [Cordylochernes scorpioides]